MNSVPVGSLPRDAALRILRPFATGASHQDPTQLFSQLKGMGPPDEAEVDLAAVSGILDTTPDRLCFILLVNALTVPLTVAGAPYFDCGDQVVAPVGNAIPAATADDVRYGLFAFGNNPNGFYGTEGAFQIKAQGAALPYGVTIGWRVSAAQLAWQSLTFAGGVSLHSVSGLENWCDKNVDDSSKHSGSDTLNDVRATWAVCGIPGKGGYTFMTVLIESTS